MKYVCLVYGEESILHAMAPHELADWTPTPSRMTAPLSGKAGWSSPRRCSRSGHPRPCGAGTARMLVTDGPFAETKEQLLGFVMVEADESRRSPGRRRRDSALPAWAASRCGRSTTSPAPDRPNRTLADVDPFRAGKRDDALGSEPHRRVGGASGGDDLVEAAQRNVAIDGQRRRQSERTDAADGMAGRGESLVGVEHARLGAEAILEFSVVQSGGAACDHKNDAVAHTQADRLGDLRRLDAMRCCGKRHRRRACLGVDDSDVGGSFGKEGADRIQTHFQIASPLSRRGVSADRPEAWRMK